MPVLDDEGFIGQNPYYAITGEVNKGQQVAVTVQDEDRERTTFEGEAVYVLERRPRRNDPVILSVMVNEEDRISVGADARVHLHEPECPPCGQHTDRPLYLGKVTRGVVVEE